MNERKRKSETWIYSLTNQKLPLIVLKVAWSQLQIILHTYFIFWKKKWGFIFLDAVISIYSARVDICQYQRERERERERPHILFIVSRTSLPSSLVLLLRNNLFLSNQNYSMELTAKIVNMENSFFTSTKKKKL